MTKSQYQAIQLRRTEALTGMTTSKSYRQVAMRALCKRCKTPADTWRGIDHPSTIDALESLATTLVGYGSLTPKQYGYARNLLANHHR